MSEPAAKRRKNEHDPLDMQEMEYAVAGFFAEPFLPFLLPAEEEEEEHALL